MQCPKCRLQSLPTAVSCDCGHSFTESPGADAAAEWSPGQAPPAQGDQGFRRLNLRHVLRSAITSCDRALRWSAVKPHILPASRHGDGYLDLTELEKRYAEMDDQEFGCISREDLAAAAIPCYDLEARRRGLPEPKCPLQRMKLLPQSILTQARENLLRCAKLTLSRLAKLYAEMSEEDFARINREDLIPFTKPYYDREAGRRSLSSAKSRARQTNIPRSRYLDLAELEKRYGEMSSQEFTRISRGDLADAAKPFYDYEARRRGFITAEAQSQRMNIPPSNVESEAVIPEAPIPDPEQILSEAKSRRARRAYDLEMLSQQPRANQGPWNVVNVYRKAVIPADQMGDKLIVWLRRFNVERSNGFRFDELLATACKGIGLPLTVRDSTVKSSVDEVMPRFLPFLLLWSCGMVACLKVGSGPQPPSWLVYLGIFEIAFPIACFFLARQIGYRDLNPATAKEETLELIVGIIDRSGRHGDDSVIIVRCQDSSWREVVQLCLTHASAVLIDVTEVTENLIWELKTALQLMPPESITLARGLGTYDEAELPEEARETLIAELGTDGSHRVQEFFFPLSADHPDNDLWGTKRYLEEELEARLAVAVAYSEYRRAFGSSATS